MTTTVVFVCDRCNVKLPGPATLAAHQERCFVVGDWVRWEYRSHWSEGELRCHMPDGVADVRVATSSRYRDVGKMTSMLVCNLRRIRRPEQEWRQVFQNGADRSQPCTACGKMFGQHYGVACELPRLDDYQKPWDLQQAAAQQSADIVKRAREFRDATMKHLAAPMSKPPTVEAPWMSPDKPCDPLDVMYDGVMLRDLLEVDRARRQETNVGGVIPWRNVDPWTWTPVQRAAISAHWSAELRAKVAASGSAERNQVVLDDDEALLAGCMSVE